LECTAEIEKRKRNMESMVEQLINDKSQSGDLCRRKYAPLRYNAPYGSTTPDGHCDKAREEEQNV
jgi:hypothetical protein